MIDFSDINISDSYSSQQAQSSGQKNVSGKKTGPKNNSTSSVSNSILVGGNLKRLSQDTSLKGMSNVSQINSKNGSSKNDKSDCPVLEFSSEIATEKVCQIQNKMFLNRNQRVFADLDKNELCEL